MAANRAAHVDERDELAEVDGLGQRRAQRRHLRQAGALTRGLGDRRLARDCSFGHRLLHTLTHCHPLRLHQVALEGGEGLPADHALLGDLVRHELLALQALLR